MREGKSLTPRNAVVSFIVDEYFDGNPDKAARGTGFKRNRIDAWLSGRKTPQKANLKRLIHAAAAPHFRTIVEFAPTEVPPDKSSLRAHLHDLLAGFEKASGVYAFYDSFGGLLYVGKSDGNLTNECVQQLDKPLRASVVPRNAKQPRGAARPTRRRDVVRYLSAWHVRKSEFTDNARHIESLILRMSKPPLNTIIANLEPAIVEETG